MVKESANKEAVKAVAAEVKPVEAAKKEEVKKAAPAAKKAPAKKAAAKKAPAKKAAKKLGNIIFEFDGQQIDIKAIQKKASKFDGDVYVVAGEKKIYDKDGKAVELF